MHWKTVQSENRALRKRPVFSKDKPGQMNGWGFNWGRIGFDRILEALVACRG